MKNKKMGVIMLVSGSVLLWVGLAPAGAVTLPEVVGHALRHSPEVKVKLYQYYGAEADQRLARAGFLPSVELSYASGRSNQENPLALDRAPGRPSGAQDFAMRSHWGWAAEINQNLFNGFQTLYAYRQQNHGKDAQFFQFVDISERQGFEAARAYLDSLRQRQLLQAAQENQAQHKKIYDLIEQRVNARGQGANGAIGLMTPRVDLDQALGRLALAESNVLTAQANLADAQARYERIVGQPLSADMADYAPADWQAPQDEADWQRVLLQAPANQATFVGLRAAKEGVHVRRGAFLPTFDARLRHEYGSGRPGASTGRNERKLFELVTVINLSRGGADRARLDRAAQDLNAAQAQREQSCREVRQSVAMASSDIDKLQHKLGALRQHALSSERVRQASLAQFNLGKKTLLDMLDTQNEHFLARSALIDAQTDLKLATLRARSVSGELLASMGLRPQVDARVKPALRAGESACPKLDPL